jgi:hypothetical protein
MLGKLKSMIYSLNRDKQSGIQIRDEGIDQGARGQAINYNFTGSGASASVVGDTMTVAVTGGIETSEYYARQAHFYYGDNL